MGVSRTVGVGCFWNQGIELIMSSPEGLPKLGEEERLRGSRCVLLVGRR